MYNTELRINVPGVYFVSGLGQCTKEGATVPPSRLFVRERTRLLVLFPRSVTFQTKNWGKFGEKCPIYKTELRINVPGEYFFSGLGQCTKAGATEPPSQLFVREKTRLLVTFPRSVTFQTKKRQIKKMT